MHHGLRHAFSDRNKDSQHQGHEAVVPPPSLLASAPRRELRWHTRGRTIPLSSGRRHAALRTPINRYGGGRLLQRMVRRASLRSIHRFFDISFVAPTTVIFLTFCNSKR